jgi:hypothetical protein
MHANFVSRYLRAPAALGAIAVAFAVAILAASGAGAWAQEQPAAPNPTQAEQTQQNPAEKNQPEDSGAKVLQSFEHEAPGAAQDKQGDQTRRWVMFGLGAPLLLLLLATGALGIAMGVYGKPVYLAHMICAGLSITLAIVHAIVGLVWFLPF